MTKKDIVLNQSGAGVLITGNRCYRCDYEWRPNDISKMPRVCPNCKSPYWDRPKKNGKNNE